jgi:glycerol-3-phosphate dehydrogenase
VLASDSGLVTITGGKWTTYRRMAETAVDLAATVGGLPRRPCETADLRLHGWRSEPDDSPFSGYGSDAEAVAGLVRERPALGEVLHPSLPQRAVEVVWAAREEAARSVEDVLARRTRALFLDARASIEAAPQVSALLAQELGRDSRWAEEQVATYREVAAGYLFPS